jgi:arylamine N-acetyltransferase
MYIEATQYTQPQVTQYLARIGYNGPINPDLPTLKKLILQHVATVPFENFSIHYSSSHELSIDKEDLFDKVVVRRRGGYCMELNNAFVNLLRALGYVVMTGGARVNLLHHDATAPPDYLGWNHQTLYVFIDGRKYLVDVGFGGPGLIAPIEIVEGAEVSGVPPASHRLVTEYVGSFNATKQWVLQHKHTPDSAWISLYVFDPNTEFLQADYVIMTYFTNFSPTTIFTNRLLGSIVLLNGEGQPYARRVMLDGEFKERQGESVTMLESCKDEKERVSAIAKYYGITLNEEEQNGMRGRIPEINLQPLAKI